MVTCTWSAGRCWCWRARWSCTASTWMARSLRAQRLGPCACSRTSLCRTLAGSLCRRRVLSRTTCRFAGAEEVAGGGFRFGISLLWSPRLCRVVCAAERGGFCFCREKRWERFGGAAGFVRLAVRYVVAKHATFERLVGAEDGRVEVSGDFVEGPSGCTGGKNGRVLGRTDYRAEDSRRFVRSFSAH